MLVECNDLRTIANMEEICDELIVLIISGRPVMITDMIDNWDAVVASWLPGSEGQGIADVLFGLEPFTGQLPYTWPANIDQLPFDFESLADEQIPVLYPFGFGLRIGE